MKGLVVAVGLGLLLLLGERTRRNPLDLAEQESAEFHGESRETRRLTRAERKPLPAEVVVLGEVEDVGYRVTGKSQRAGLWRHKFGDRGRFVPPATERPLLVADPKTERVAIVQGKSPARFEPDRGIVG